MPTVTIPFVAPKNTTLFAGAALNPVPVIVIAVDGLAIAGLMFAIVGGLITVSVVIAAALQPATEVPVTV